MTVRHNPLAMQRFRARKAELNARVANGDIAPDQAKLQLGEFTHSMIDKIREREKPRDQGEPPKT